MNKLFVVFVLVLACSACAKTNSDTEAYLAQIGKDSVTIRNFLVANNIPIKKVSDTIGVYYQIIDSGTVASSYTSSTLITVGYTAKIIPKPEIISKTDTIHPSYTLGNVIRGWRVGIPLINKYGRIRLFVPSRYAYGPVSQTSNLMIPGGSCLDFDIRLYNVTN
ncbi:FKBP-type peptidyl-prolyl cis-trans isomerase [Mucilaginibacter sp.]|uniref:FKBP-type peptidyl-prolyl cis-trans isomerase n=1 Tax=Mucilaginibacter sp. TaxID=1882438 RepID=UPI003AFFBC55